MSGDEPTIVYTDGSSLGNPGPGGWAWVVPDGPYASGAEANTTNQRMEVTAVLEVLQAIDGPITVFSDSTYVVNCFKNRWYDGWFRRGWKNSQGKAVANQDLWKPLLDLYRGRRGITFRWVKGHSGDTMNDMADELAVNAAKTQKGTSGTASSALIR